MELLFSCCLCSVKKLSSRNVGGRMGNETGKEELCSNISHGHSIVRACVLWLYLKWQIPFLSQQREMGAPALRLPACGCASARAKLGWFPTDKLFCGVAFGGWTGVGCRNSGGSFLSHPSCTVTESKTGECLNHMEVHKKVRWLCMALGGFCCWCFHFFYQRRILYRFLK